MQRMLRALAAAFGPRPHARAHSTATSHDAAAFWRCVLAQQDEGEQQQRKSSGEERLEPSPAFKQAAAAHIHSLAANPDPAGLIAFYSRAAAREERGFYLSALAAALGPQRHALKEAVKQWAELQQQQQQQQQLQQRRQQPAEDQGAQADALQRVAARLSAAADPVYKHVFNAIAQEAGGIPFLVNLRADALEAQARQPAYGVPLRTLSEHLRQALASWCSPGLLSVQRVSWEASSGALLEKVLQGEAVHPMAGWDDLRRRLREDRRVFTFLHPCLPGEPLVILHAALATGGLARATSVDEILRAPASQPRQPAAGHSSHHHATTSSQPRQPAAGHSSHHHATTSGQPHQPAAGHSSQQPDTAVFYSISATQRGLAGVDLGAFMIKRVAAQLKQEFPSLQTLVTLSPMPGFQRWLLARLASEDLERQAPPPSTTASDSSGLDSGPTADAPPATPPPPLITASEAADLVRSVQHLLPSEARGRPAACLALLLQGGTWLQPRFQHVEPLLQRLLLRAAARYLLLERRRNKALDPVAQFHLGNGAILEALQWRADTSPAGLKRSCGMCVNYLYAGEAHVHANSRAYAVHHTIAVSDKVRSLLEPGTR